MALMTLRQYRQKVFAEGSRPSINTIKKWVDNGDVYGEVIGGRYYVDPEKAIPVNHLVDKVVQQGR